MRKLLSRIRHGKPSEEAELLAKAVKYPRYTPHRFKYRNYQLEVTDFLSVAWQIMEFFGDERMAFSTANAQPVILDCGSNVGISVLYFKSKFPKARISCFEADPQVAEVLRRNLKTNGADDVEVFQRVVWTHADGVSFGSEGADGGSVHHGNNANILPSIRLKDVLQQHEAIDLLKIDIEGAEVEVLKDCADELHRIKYLYVEYHSLGNRPQELDALLHVLSVNGFRYYIHRIGTFHAQPFLTIEDHPMDVQLDIHALRQ
jgi:FkbM family methyltransferase